MYVSVLILPMYLILDFRMLKQCGICFAFNLLVYAYLNLLFQFNSMKTNIVLQNCN